MTETSHTPKRRRKRVSDDRILDAACREFSDAGYASAVIDRIAADAATTKMTVYARFDSKEDLFRAALAREGDLLRQRLLRAYDIDLTIPLAERLHIYVEAFFDFERDRPDGFKLLFVNDGAAAVIQDTTVVLVERIAALVAHSDDGNEVLDYHRVIAALIVGATVEGARTAAATGMPTEQAAALTESFLANAVRFKRLMKASSPRTGAIDDRASKMGETQPLP